MCKQYRYYGIHGKLIAMIYTDQENALRIKPILETELNEPILYILETNFMTIAEYSIFTGEKVEAKNG